MAQCEHLTSQCEHLRLGPLRPLALGTRPTRRRERCRALLREPRLELLLLSRSSLREISEALTQGAEFYLREPKLLRLQSSYLSALLRLSLCLAPRRERLLRRLPLRRERLPFPLKLLGHHALREGRLA